MSGQSVPKLRRACYTRTGACAPRGHGEHADVFDVFIAGEGARLESAEVARAIVDAAADKKASDVILLDIRELSVLADYFVICTGNNPRQINAIRSAIQDAMDAMGERDVHRRGQEGSAESGWLLLDYGDVVVHIFGPMEREFYRLERLWSGAPTVVYLE